MNEPQPRTVDQQIQFFEDLAARQYPESELARSQYENTLLKQRLRELTAMQVALNVRTM